MAIVGITTTRDAIGGMVGAVVLLVISYVVLKSIGFLDLQAKAGGGANNENNDDNDDEGIQMQSQHRLGGSGRFSLAPQNTSVASDKNGYNYSYYSPPPYPKDTLPPQPMEYPQSMMQPVEHNDVVLMSTLEEFPWHQIPPNVGQIDIQVEANLGPQPSDTFLVVETDEGFKVRCDNGMVCLEFMGVRLALYELNYVPPPSPIGVFTLSATAKFTGAGMELRAQAQVGDRQLQQNPDVKIGQVYGSDPRAKFQSLKTQMYQGTNVNALQTKVKWRTTTMTTGG